MQQTLTGATALRPIAAPPYDRTRITPRIVHLGLGGFARAHLAAYVHDLMKQDPGASRWGIVGAGLRSADRPLLAALQRQDGLYTLIERDAAGERREVIGSVIGTVDAADDASDLLRTAADPRIAIVSLTVTEHGYCLDRATKRLDLEHPLIVRDLATPGDPRSAIGIVSAILSGRRATGNAGVTVLSCDNIQHNGDVLRGAVLAFASALDAGLAEWTDREVAFPNAMVDRITPQPTDQAVLAFRADTGIDDGAPLMAEPFRQWVIEDRFTGDRPPLDRAGVQFVSDVTSHERMKLRLLNASHLAMAGFGQVMGLTGIAETIGHPAIRRYVTALMDRETRPSVGDVPGVDLEDYQRVLLDRFANPAIPDTVARVNADAALNYLLDPLRDRRRADEPTDLLSLALAGWLRRVRGLDEEGRPFPVVHPLAAQMQAAATAGGSDPRPLLSIRSLFGDLVEDERLTSRIEGCLASLDSFGVAATLTRT